MSYKNKDSIEVSILIPEEFTDDIAPFSSVSSCLYTQPDITKDGKQISKSWYRINLNKFEPGGYNAFFSQLLKRVHEGEIIVLGVTNFDSSGQLTLNNNSKPTRQEFLISPGNKKEIPWENVLI